MCAAFYLIVCCSFAHKYRLWTGNQVVRCGQVTSTPRTRHKTHKRAEPSCGGFVFIPWWLISSNKDLLPEAIVYLAAQSDRTSYTVFLTEWFNMADRKAAMSLKVLIVLFLYKFMEQYLKIEWVAAQHFKVKNVWLINYMDWVIYE